MNETIHRDLGNRVRRFLADYRVNPKEFAKSIFGISQRAFNRLLTKPSFNWVNCKPVTKQRLLKLKALLDDQNKLKELLLKQKSSNGATVASNMTMNGDEEEVKRSYFRKNSLKF